MEFKDKLKWLLMQRGVSAADVAGRKEVGVSSSSLNRYISGKQVPRLDEIDGLAKFFQVPKAYLADETITAPEQVGGVASLPRAEQRVVEKGRLLGVEEAAEILDICWRLGVDESLARLIGRPPAKPGAVEGGDVGAGHVQAVGGGDSDRRDDRGPADHPVAKAVPRPRR